MKSIIWYILIINVLKVRNSDRDLSNSFTNNMKVYINRVSEDNIN